MRYPYLRDYDFLDKLSHQRYQRHLAKITLLNWDEKPLFDTTALISSASFNISSTSVLRRTGNCNIVISSENEKEVNQIDIDKKIKLEIGIVNQQEKYSDYPIIWFPMGVFVVMDKHYSIDTEKKTLNLTLKDKMVLLNGECGGTIPAKASLDMQEEFLHLDNTYELKKVRLFNLIQESVHHFGGEDLTKIFITDVPNEIKQVMHWTSDTPLYAYEQLDGGKGTGSFIYTTNEMEAKAFESQPESFALADGAPFNKGDNVGFIFTDFVYPTDLALEAGANVCSLLNKILTILPNHEYFYDVNGNFVFREKPNYENISQATKLKEEIRNTGGLSSDSYQLNSDYSSMTYTFKDADLLIAYTPGSRMTNFKNDLILWGESSKNNKGSFPIRYHLVIDEKPKTGNSYQVVIADENIFPYEKIAIPYMAAAADLPKVGADCKFYYVTDTQKVLVWSEASQKYITTDYALETIVTNDWRTELLMQGLEAEKNGLQANPYFAELRYEWPELYDIRNGRFYQDTLDHLENVRYFFDMISTPQLAPYSVSKIGNRTKVRSDSKVNCMFEPLFPDVILIASGTEETQEKVQESIRQGQRYCQVNQDIYGGLSIGGFANSAFENIKQDLYFYAQKSQQLDFSCIPLYFIEPNSRIIFDTGLYELDGSYTVNELHYNITAQRADMAITATEIKKKH